MPNNAQDFNETVKTFFGIGQQVAERERNQAMQDRMLQARQDSQSDDPATATRGKTMWAAMDPQGFREMALAQNDQQKFMMEQQRAQREAQLFPGQLAASQMSQAEAPLKFLEMWKKTNPHLAGALEANGFEASPNGAAEAQQDPQKMSKIVVDAKANSVMAASDLTPEERSIARRTFQPQDIANGILTSPQGMQRLTAAVNEYRKHGASQIGGGATIYGGSASQQTSLDATGRDEAFFSTLPPAMQPVVKSIVDGKLAMPPATIRNGTQNPVVAAAMRYEPGFDSTTFQQRQTANKDFSAGGKAGQALGAFNLAMQHAGKLSDAIDDLNNGKTVIFNKAENYALDQHGDPRITRFNATAHALAGEAGKIFRGGGQTTDDEQHAMDAVLNVNASKAQQKAAAKTLVELMESRVNVLRSQWENAFRGSKPFNFVSPEAEQVLSTKFGGDPGTSRPATKTPPAAQGASALLPVGTRVKFPDGKIRPVTKPVPLPQGAEVVQ